MNPAKIANGRFQEGVLRNSDKLVMVFAASCADFAGRNYLKSGRQARIRKP